jgi:hypothetical protein
MSFGGRQHRWVDIYSFLVFNTTKRDADSLENTFIIDWEARLL